MGSRIVNWYSAALGGAEGASMKVGATRVGEAPDELLAEHQLDQALEIWNAARGDAFAPRWSAVDLLSFPAHLRAGTMVADVMDGGRDYFIRYWGMELVDSFGIELTGKLLSEADHKGVMDSFIESAKDIVSTRLPQRPIHRIRLENGLARDIPDLRLPLSEDGETVTAIMTVENIGKSFSSYVEPPGSGI